MRKTTIPILILVLAAAFLQVSCSSPRVMRMYLVPENVPAQTPEPGMLMHNYLDEMFDDWVLDLTARAEMTTGQVDDTASHAYSFGIRFLLPQDTVRGIPFDQKYRDDTGRDLLHVQGLAITIEPQGIVHQLAFEDKGMRPRFIGFGRLTLNPNVTAIRLKFEVLRENPFKEIVNRKEYDVRLVYYEGELKQ